MPSSFAADDLDDALWAKLDLACRQAARPRSSPSFFRPPKHEVAATRGYGEAASEEGEDDDVEWEVACRPRASRQKLGPHPTRWSTSPPKKSMRDKWLPSALPANFYPTAAAAAAGAAAAIRAGCGTPLATKAISRTGRAGVGGTLPREVRDIGAMHALTGQGEYALSSVTSYLSPEQVSSFPTPAPKCAPKAGPSTVGAARANMALLLEAAACVDAYAPAKPRRRARSHDVLSSGRPHHDLSTPHRLPDYEPPLGALPVRPDLFAAPTQPPFHLFAAPFAAPLAEPFAAPHDVYSSALAGTPPAAEPAFPAFSTATGIAATPRRPPSTSCADSEYTSSPKARRPYALPTRASSTKAAGCAHGARQEKGANDPRRWEVGLRA